MTKSRRPLPDERRHQGTPGVTDAPLVGGRAGIDRAVEQGRAEGRPRVPVVRRGVARDRGRPTAQAVGRARVARGCRRCRAGEQRQRRAVAVDRERAERDGVELSREARLAVRRLDVPGEDRRLEPPQRREAPERGVLEEANNATDSAEAMAYPAAGDLFEKVYAESWQPWVV